MKTIGIDQSYTGTGIVLLQNKTVIEWQEISCKIEDYDSIGNLFVQIKKFALDFKPDMVGIEGYAFGAANRMAHLGELGGILKYRMWKSCIPFVVIGSTVWKKFLIGNGLAKKDLVIKEVYKRYGFENNSNNVVDSFCIAIMTEKVMFAKSTAKADRTEAQKQMLKKVSFFG